MDVRESGGSPGEVDPSLFTNHNGHFRPQRELTCIDAGVTCADKILEGSRMEG